MNHPAVETTDSAIILETAIQHHRAGRLLEAAHYYESLLDREPEHPDALHLMGVIAHQIGRHASAMELINKALEVKPMAPEFYNSLGAIQQAVGNEVEAVRLYLHAIGLKDDYIEAYNNLIRLRPAAVDVRFNLGCILHRQGKTSAAVDHYVKVLELQPSHAVAHNNLGCALRDLGRHDDAISHLRRAIEARHDYAEAHNNLGCALQDKGAIDDAIASYHTAFSLQSNFVDAYYNLGRALQLDGGVEKAIGQYQRVIEIAPNHIKAYYNWACALHELGFDNEAIEKYEEAIHCDPSYVEAHVNRAILLLLASRYPEGWREYEWRLLRPDWMAANSSYPEIPRWDGSVITDQSILVQAEQGFGDTMQFARYLPMVKARCGKLILEAPSELHPLLETMEAIDELTIRQQENSRKADHAIHLLSLPGVFGTTADSIPATIPYLLAPSARMEKWRDRVPAGGIRIGITWSGNPAHPENKDRSCDIRHFASLAALPSVRLFSLQKGVAAEQIQETFTDKGIVDLSPELHDFADTAAAIMHLDLIISVDTAMVHLAGALGKPVWTLRYHIPYWVWGTRGDHSPWYPSMRIFRQKNPGDWDGLFQEVTGKLGSILAVFPTSTCQSPHEIKKVAALQEQW